MEGKLMLGPDSFAEGADAAAAGRTFLACPYEWHSNHSEFEKWLRGFNIARRRMVDAALAASGRRTLGQWAE